MGVKRICFLAASLLAAFGILAGALYVAIPGNFRLAYHLLKVVGYLV